jgi:hypothetical protein
MYVICDTNTLHRVAYARSVPEWLSDLADTCTSTLLLPAIVLLELEHIRDQKCEQERVEVEEARSLLVDHGVECNIEDIDYRDDFSVVDELSAVGFDVQVEDHTLDDYNDAVSRAAGRQPPADEDTKEQVRDLAIWALALRIARERDGAFFVSRDKLFWSKNESVRSEMKSAGLIRFRELRPALGSIGVIDEDVLALLRELWATMIQNDLLLKDPPSWRAIEVRSMRKTSGRIERLVASIEADAVSKGSTELVLKYEVGSGSRSFELLEGSNPGGEQLPTGPFGIEQDETIDLEADQRYEERIELLRSQIGQ